MIKMQEVIDLLADCELSNIFYVDNDTKELNLKSVPALVRSINMGVLELHKRFCLKMGTIEVVLDKDRVRYPIRPEHQVGNTTRPGVPQFILAGDYKLDKRTVLKIESITGKNNIDYELNGGDPRYSVRTPQADILLFPQDSCIEYHNYPVKVTFRMAPKRQLIADEFDDSWPCKDVDIPYTHLQALIYYVASRTHNPMGFAENTTNEGNNYARKFESECQNLDSLNLRVDDQGFDNRFRQGGWA